MIKEDFRVRESSAPSSEFERGSSFVGCDLNFE